MVLNDIAIREQIAFHQLVEVANKPYSKCWRYYDNSIQPASYDFHLSDVFKRIERKHWEYVDIDEEIQYNDLVCKDGIIIQPREFLLGFTKEIVNLPKDMGMHLSTRSSFGRAGITMGFGSWVNPGYRGRICVEIFNAGPNPVKLRAGIRVLQGVFVKLCGQAEYGYDGKYQNAIEYVGSRLHNEFKLLEESDNV